MPRRKAKQKDEEDSATDPEPVPESPPKKAKKAMPPPAARPNMTLSSTSIRRVIERSHWPGPPPRLPRGPYQAIQEAKRKEEERKKRKGEEKAKDKDEDEDDDEQEEEDEKKEQDARPPIVKYQAAAGQRAPVSSVESINRSLQAKKDSEPKKDVDPNAPIINTPYQIELSQSTYLKFQSDRKHIYRSSAKITPSSMLRENSLRYLLFSRDSNDGSYRDNANITALVNAYKHGSLEWSDDGKVTYLYKGKQLTEPKEYGPEEHKRIAGEKEDSRALGLRG